MADAIEQFNKRYPPSDRPSGNADSGTGASEQNDNLDGAPLESGSEGMDKA